MVVQTGPLVALTVVISRAIVAVNTLIVPVVSLWLSPMNSFGVVNFKMWKYSDNDIIICQNIDLL